MDRKKLFLLLLLSLAMVFTLAFAGCGKSGDTTDDDGDNPGGTTSESYNIALNTWGSGVPILDNFGDVSEWTLKTLGNTTTRASDDFTADKELSNAQNFVSQGVDGVVFQAAAPPILPEAAKLFADAKIPFVLSVFIGDDPDFEKVIAENDYIVGGIDSDMVEDGRMIGQAALDNGVKTAITIGGNVGDNNMDQRIAGFQEVFEAGGGTLITNIRCTDASEAAQKAEDTLSSNKDVDAVYALVGDYIPGALSAIDNLGIEGIQVYVSCTDKATAEEIKAGRVIRGNDGINIAAFITPTLLQNWLEGNKILTPDGKAPHFRTKPFAVTADNVDDYLSIFYAGGDSQPFTKDMIDNLIVSKNSSTTYDTYVQMFDSGLTLEAFKEAHK